jgi:hypothetical protein
MKLGTFVVIPGKKLDIFIALPGNETGKLSLPHMEKELETFVALFEIEIGNFNCLTWKGNWGFFALTGKETRNFRCLSLK